MLLVGGAATPQPRCVTGYNARLLTDIGESRMKAYVAIVTPRVEFLDGCYASKITKINK
jgi:hypothetical protein